MKIYITLILIVLLVACLIKVYIDLKEQKKKSANSTTYYFDVPDEIKEKMNDDKKFKADDVSVYYKINYTFSPNEFYAFKNIKEIADKYNLLVFPKMRLADICGVKKGTKYWNAYFSKIKSKHIDFILCDNVNYSPTIAIELDDNSHEKADRKKRDEFVDSVMKHIGIPILHIYNTKNLEEKIRILLNTNDIEALNQIAQNN